MISGVWNSDGMDTDGKAIWKIEQQNPADTGPVSEQFISMAVSGGTPMNLMLRLDSVPRNYLFEVKIEELEHSSSVSAGVVRPSEFKKGYRTRGLFYNGNLTNGIAALKKSHGARPQTGDTMVVEYVEDSWKVRVSFHLNGKSLGSAFEIDNNEPASESFLPCLHGHGKIAVKTKFLDVLPNIEHHLSHPIEGEWYLEKAIGASPEVAYWPLPGVSLNLPTPNIKINISPCSTESNTNVISTKVFNVLRIGKIITQTSESEYCLGGSERVATTRMMAPTPFDEIEQQLCMAFEQQWRSLRVQESKMLAISSDGVTLGIMKRVDAGVDSVPLSHYL